MHYYTNKLMHDNISVVLSFNTGKNETIVC